MRFLKICVINFSVALFLLSGNLLAQEENTTTTTLSQDSNGSPGVFLRMGVGARALGMGSAFTALANDASAAYWNPAGLEHVRSAQFEFMNVDLPFDRRFNYISSAIPVRGMFTLGVSWVGLRITGIEGRSGNSAQPEYFFGNSQDALFFSVGSSLNQHISFGGSVKLIRNNLDNDLATGLGFDAGMMLRVTDWLSFGALAQDIGTDYRWKSGLTEGVPLTLRLGTAVEVYEGVTVSADVNRTSGQPMTLHLGAEIRPVEMMPLRLGFNDSQITGGAGFAFPLSSHMLELNYGYASDRLLNDDIHRVSVILSLGKKSMPGYRSPGNIYNATKSRKKRSPSSQISGSKGSLAVTAKLLNVRSGPGAQYWKVGQIRKGQRFALLEKRGDWRKIRLASGRVGWVHRDYVMTLQN